MTRRIAQSLTVLAITALAGSAFAEAGDGVKAGRMNVSPGLSLFGAYDSNVFRQSPDEQASDLWSAPVLTIQPFLKISTDEPGTVDAAFDGAIGWQQYLSGDDVLSEQSGLTTRIGGTLGINRPGAVSLTLGESFTRTNEPPDGPTTTSYNRNFNSLGATIGLHPGGQVFQHYLSYDWQLYLHDELEGLDRTTHDFTLKNYWRFLPRTAAVLTADYSLTEYHNPDNAQGFASVNNTPLRIKGGLSGLITNRLNLRLMGGWGWSFHETGTSFTGLVVDTELGYQFGPKSANSKFYIGYDQAFADTSIANYYTYMRPRAGVGIGLARNRLRFDLSAAVQFRTYQDTTQDVEALNVPADLSDTLVTADAKFSFNFLKWWSAHVAYGLNMNVTDDVLTTSTLGSDVVREYTRHVITLGTTIKY